MSNVIIDINNLGKCFKLYDNNIKRIIEFANRRKKLHTDFWSLKNINLKVCEGDAIGVIGPNGAGKSTLLKILCGALRPSEGNVEVKGRILSLLELGTGFLPELTGIENIYNSASMQGFSRSTIEEKLEEIIKFADIGEYINYPIKTYSSGMYVRLAFALYACLEPDIYVVDEALSVGDVFFQQKCYERLRKMKQKGVTIIMVSHDPTPILQFCNRAVLIDKGCIAHEGTPSEVLELYQALQYKKIMREEKSNFKIDNGVSFGNNKAELLECYILNSDGYEKQYFNVGEICRIVIKYKSEELAKANIGIQIKNRIGTIVYGTNSNWKNKEILFECGIATVIYEVKLNLFHGNYTVTVAASDDSKVSEEIYSWDANTIQFDIVSDGCSDFSGEVYLECNIVDN